LIVVAILLLTPLLWGAAAFARATLEDGGSTTVGIYVEPWLLAVVGVLTAISAALFVLASRVH